jgi:hypothetical protein
VKCAFCGVSFEVSDSRTSCRGCPMSGACRKILCPNCGYEGAAGPDLNRLKDLWKRISRRQTGDRTMTNGGEKNGMRTGYLLEEDTWN